jgi:hypothetical protein
MKKKPRRGGQRPSLPCHPPHPLLPLPSPSPLYSSSSLLLLLLLFLFEIQAIVGFSLTVVFGRDPNRATTSLESDRSHRPPPRPLRSSPLYSFSLPSLFFSVL